MRCRHEGDRVVAVLDGAKPFRRTDLSPREELAEARKNLAMLKATKCSYPDFPEVQHNFREQEEKIRRLETVVWMLDHARSQQGIATLAQLNQRNAEFWEGRR
jgi:hypothetical protein